MSTKKLQTSRRKLLKGTAASAAIAPFFIGRSAPGRRTRVDPEVRDRRSERHPLGRPREETVHARQQEDGGKGQGQGVLWGRARGRAVRRRKDEGRDKRYFRRFVWRHVQDCPPSSPRSSCPTSSRTRRQGRKVLAANRQIIHDILWDRGYKLWFFSENGTQDIGSTRPVEKPSDMKGLKIRTLESDVHINCVKAVGRLRFPWA